MSTEELKAKLLAEAETVIDGMLSKQQSVAQMNLREIVALAQESGRQVATAVVSALSQAGSNEKQVVSCEQCGQVMACKGKRSRDIVTSAGALRLERDYYYCACCKAGYFPPG